MYKIPSIASSRAHHQCIHYKNGAEKHIYNADRLQSYKVRIDSTVDIFME